MSLQNKYDEYTQTIRSIQEHLGSIDSQLYEHKIVVETLESVPAERKAWRLVSNGDSIVSSSKEEGADINTANGALVETTAKDASIKLQATVKGLAELKSKLEKEIVELRKEFEDWKEKNNVKIYRG